MALSGLASAGAMAVMNPAMAPLAALQGIGSIAGMFGEMDADQARKNSLSVLLKDLKKGAESVQLYGERQVDMLGESYEQTAVSLGEGYNANIASQNRDFEVGKSQSGLAYSGGIEGSSKQFMDKAMKDFGSKFQGLTTDYRHGVEKTEANTEMQYQDIQNQIKAATMELDQLGSKGFMDYFLS